ncbi:iron-containing redox enzyme family protein [Dyella caseinilytica]|uniref:iron-containing redox enzyme family protein n=1 Tax=Dyella caseinilytica TaxID=1849581 RepID=UPI00193F0580|nr:iron-containing redox enzyme family protein [Dyella caseinilytica]GFZ90496.1 hypothetical protein GCM10011408_07060 [Dyella caseinilytica]
MHSSMTDLDHPRKKAIAAMRASLPLDLWQKNALFVENLRHLIGDHPVASHPAIDMLNSGELNMASMRMIHLEYRHAIVQIFTDALLAAQMQARQLEPRLRAGAKLAPRFLITLNDLDEFGFRPGVDTEGYYRGNPAYAHYPLFERVLDEYGIDQERRRNYVPSRVATGVRRCLERSYRNYLEVTVLLAAAEEEVILFSPPLRAATRALGISVDDGYYFVHGISEDKTAEAADDDHENDLWLILTQALTPDQYTRVQEVCLQYCDLWDRFWTYQMNKVRLRQRAHPRRRRPFTTRQSPASGTYAAY